MKKDVELDINKLIYNPMIKTLYTDSTKKKYAECEQDRENYLNCLIKMQQTGRRKWTKRCFQYEQALMNCVNKVKLQKMGEKRKEVEAKSEKIKVQKPNEGLLHEMEEEFKKQKKMAEALKTKYAKK